MVKIFDLATELETASVEIGKVENLLQIVLTEVFEECRAENSDSLFGRLSPYTQQFETVLEAAIVKVDVCGQKIDSISEKLYELHENGVSA